MESGDTALIILSIAISGYIFSTFCYRLRYKTARESGHRLYLTCASVGWVFVLIGYALIQLVVTICTHYRFGSWLVAAISPSHEPLFVSALSPALSTMAMVVYNSLPHSKSRNIERVWAKNDFDSLISYVTGGDKPNPLSLTLDTRKVYIGMVARTNEPDDGSSHVTLLPLFSGFRDPNSLELSLENRYDEVFDYFDPLQNGPTTFDIRDFLLVIPLSQIVTANPFNYHIYKRLHGVALEETAA